MKTTNRPSECKVAIIGAGLAGLSAAYHLRGKAHVTIFEKDDRIGGRVFTSRQLPGEHGAEFLLQSECELVALLATLGVTVTPCLAGPWYFFKGRYASGYPDEAAKQLLPRESTKRVFALCNLVVQEQWPSTTKRFDQWLSSFLAGDKDTLRFIRMLLAGDTCAPLHHLSTRYGLESLSSLFNDDWYRIEGGSAKLATELFGQSKACLRTSSRVSRVEPIQGGVEVRWREAEGQKSEDFQAVIIATPNGERLLGKPVRGHYHGYLSVLLGYSSRPRVNERSDIDLAEGLYTDGPLNYIQLTERPNSPYALRILIPNAEDMFHWEESDVVAFCAEYLKPIIADADRFYTSSVKPWEFGLPCGGYDKPFEKVGNRVYLAGDRFGQWPSMDAAISSGHRAATAVDEFQTRQADAVGNAI